MKGVRNDERARKNERKQVENREREKREREREIVESGERKNRKYGYDCKTNLLRNTKKGMMMARQ